MVNHYPTPILFTPAHPLTVDGNRIMSKVSCILKANWSITILCDKLDEMHVQYRLRILRNHVSIQKQRRTSASLQTTGWDIYPLSGNEEAPLHDFLAQYSYPNLTDEQLFDGRWRLNRTDFIWGWTANRRNEFPLGCVRLRHLPPIH